VIYKFVGPNHVILHRPAMNVDMFGDSLQAMADEMFETLYAANGIGLAAPQIGLGFRVAVIDISYGCEAAAKIVLVNPKLLSQLRCVACAPSCCGPATTNRLLGAAACRRLSGPIRSAVSAPRSAARVLLARALCHELDHLNGILIDSLPDAA
jgi:peptide deformylase